jgi:Domain of unknown function (DUF4112)
LGRRNGGSGVVQRSVAELQVIRAGVARIGKLSDGLLRLGPVRLGLDGVLAWVPGLGEIYSAAAGTYIIVQGLRAGVSLPVLGACGMLMFGRTAVSALPLVGPLAADLLTAHRWASRLVIASIDRKIARGEAVVSLIPAWNWGWRPTRRAAATATA